MSAVPRRGFDPTDFDGWLLVDRRAFSDPDFVHTGKPVLFAVHWEADAPGDLMIRPVRVVRSERGSALTFGVGRDTDIDEVQVGYHRLCKLPDMLVRRLRSEPMLRDVDGPRVLCRSPVQLLSALLRNATLGAPVLDVRWSAWSGGSQRDQPAVNTRVRPLSAPPTELAEWLRPRLGVVLVEPNVDRFKGSVVVVRGWNPGCGARGVLVQHGRRSHSPSVVQQWGKVRRSSVASIADWLPLLRLTEAWPDRWFSAEPIDVPVTVGDIRTRTIRSVLGREGLVRPMDARLADIARE